MLERNLTSHAERFELTLGGALPGRKYKWLFGLATKDTTERAGLWLGQNSWLDSAGDGVRAAT